MISRPGKRGRNWKFTGGYIKHCGEASDVAMERGMAIAYMKPGVIGIQVKIMSPGVQLPDAILRATPKPVTVTETEGKEDRTAPKPTEGEEEVLANGDTQN